MSRLQIGAGLAVGLLAAGLGLAGHTEPPHRVALAMRWVEMPAPVPSVVPTVRLSADRPRMAGPTPDYRLTTPPSVSAATLDQVLAQYHSPAVGQGAVFYDLGVQAGIDPAYAVAFFIVESHAGTRGVARFTHGIGNIRVTPGYTSYEGYRSYITYTAGIADWYSLIKTLYIEGWGLTTPGPILARYAPWADGNNPDVYAATVTALVRSWQP